MESSLLFPLIFFIFLSIPSLFHISPFTTASSSIFHPLCHDNERSALLQFKNSFASSSSNSKFDSWKLERGDDCCSWDGIKCDKQTGNVIELDLSSCYLNGFINSSCSLLHLVHLQSLNLANNQFNYSQIPSCLGHFSELTHLNLSSSFFSGKIPSTISKLSKLSVLDLSNNDELMFERTDFGNLVQNLTSLEVLQLSSVNISSTLPPMLANLSSLVSLDLSDCGLYGEFPAGVFQLPYLKILKLSINQNLKGHLPEFNYTSPLQSLMLSTTSFSGKLQNSIGNLQLLEELGISHCNFAGKIPVSLENLTGLVYLDLSYNNFDGQIPSLSWIGKQSRLRILGLSKISLNGEIPSYFANLTQLVRLSLNDCHLNSQIPSWLMNMTQLLSLRLQFNQLQGSIPNSIIQLKNLELLDLTMNNLSGAVGFAMFLKLEKLMDLRLKRNNLTLLDNANSSGIILQKFHVLELGSCNLHQFPHLLHYQNELQWLDLSRNYIRGQIPKWVWYPSKDSLRMVNFAGNFLTGFEEDPAMVPWSQVIYLDLSGNMLQGSLPIPPESTQMYKIAGNNLTGEIPSAICGMKSLDYLDLSNNNLIGALPQCFGNFSASIQLLKLGSNNFRGKIPEILTEQCNLRMLILDTNNFEGQVPRSLANCARLEFLILGNNQINDVFPSWLGSLQGLKVLILRSNQFHGVLGNDHITKFDFLKLRIIDLSHNNFSGNLPTQYFLNWNAMKMVSANESSYMGATLRFQFLKDNPRISDSSYSMSITNKGITLTYSRILESFVAIDLSSNKFQGDIAEVIGSLNGLRLLNLSDNYLSGSIPSSLGNLTMLESLDLSRNNLSGEIPWELTQLNFLAVFNVSYNHLTGFIPQGKQFDTFQNNSYEGNSGLCGNPLSKKCGNAEALLPSVFGSKEDHDSGSSFQFDWKPVLIGYGSGVIMGIIVGHIVITRKYKLFLETFRIRA